MAGAVSTADIEFYQKNGVAVLRDCIAEAWINRLRVAVEKDLVFSGPHAEVYTTPEDSGLFFNDLYRKKNFGLFLMLGPMVNKYLGQIFFLVLDLLCSWLLRLID